MKEAGEALRLERLAQGLSLDQVATATRIRKSYLQALEDGNLAGLPHAFYARNFARVYAAQLGLDAEEIATAFPGTQPPRVPAKLKVVQTTSDPWGFVLGVVVLLSVVLLGVYGYSRLGPTALDYVPPLFSAGPAPTETPTVVPTVTLTRTPTPSYVGIAELRVLITAPSWLYVLVDNKTEFSATLEAGSTKTFTGKESVYMIGGNAGAVEVIYNGQEMGPLGKKGEVTRMIWTPSGGAQTPTPVPPTRTPTATPRPATQTPVATRTLVPTRTPVPTVVEEHTSTPSPDPAANGSTPAPQASATATPAQS